MKRCYRSIICVLLVCFIIVLLPAAITKTEFATYRVMLNPGHGGVALLPKSIHGDRYDPLSKKYLDRFKYGAARGLIKEHKLMYDLARKVEKLLADCSPTGDFNRFEKILAKYTNKTAPRIYIVTGLSREKSITYQQARKMRDPNSKYRFFDHPDGKGGMIKGKLSRINAFKPHLVVSLHLAAGAAPWYKGFSAVIAAPYDFLHQGLEYLRKKRTNARFFTRSSYCDWFCNSHNWGSWKCYLDDVSFYFTSYSLNKNLTTNYKKFHGYRYNMLSWVYTDDPGWEQAAKKHPAKSKYSKSYKDVAIEGKFWDRERSLYEKFRRDKGPEGFGGDNLYASNELIRYMLYALKTNGIHYPHKSPGRPYVATWIVPMHINAVSAFFELGYLNRYWDRLVVTKKQNELAEGLAVGIYSLCAGLELDKSKDRYKPKGKKLDFDKYKMEDGKSYFEKVVE